MHIIICQGTNQNSVGFQIVPVAIRIGISPEGIKLQSLPVGYRGCASGGVMHLLLTRMPAES